MQQLLHLEAVVVQRGEPQRARHPDRYDDPAGLWILVQREDRENAGANPAASKAALRSGKGASSASNKAIKVPRVGCARPVSMQLR